MVIGLTLSSPARVSFVMPALLIKVLKESANWLCLCFSFMCEVKPFHFSNGEVVLVFFLCLKMRLFLRSRFTCTMFTFYVMLVLFNC
ncbi:hypothetical protein THIOM_002317 [Candidatus Thiomargarita nelsonii]|uniref:Uncharacterized protein n=1 Tax=Candidatus Thiomargarita nelsonii TaxID=1003181 RepID=A0A176S1X4_9GAMM|nr:hypothetical protein THIOM_002317 [Candidatus Thiomargarita nelsonii]